MRASVKAFSATALALAVPQAAFAAEEPRCDRPCLTTMLDRYMKALVAHKPEQASLVYGFRQTENAVAQAVGDGLWKSATGVGPGDRRYYDPETGNASWFTRASDPGISPQDNKAVFDVKTFIAKPPPAARLNPAGRKLTRDELVAVTESYFDGIVARDASPILAHPGCTRFENGLEVTGRPLEDDRRNEGYQGRGDCMSGQGRFGVAFVAGRRYPVVDVEAQAVLAIATFIREPGNVKRRNHLMEYFYIDDGKIRDVYTAFLYPEATRPVPNWPPYDGNFPLAPNMGAPAGQ
ncbi:MAG: hypothetical protein J0G94_03230 [Sphingomonadales bacterium]|nr:hypothetical protein [Sphingomonadales bacterium]